MKNVFWCLIVLFLGGCSAEKKEVVSIPFSAQYKGQPLICGQEAPTGPRQPGAFWLSDLRFLVHDFEVRSRNGEWVAADLVPVEGFQSNTIALLDFEDGVGPCKKGTPVTNTEVRLRLPLSAKKGLRFKLGLPAELNNDIKGKQEIPTNAAALYSEQHKGYTFFQLEMVDEGGDGLFAQLRSTGCVSKKGAALDCARPNRAMIEFEHINLREAGVVLDVVELLSLLDANQKPKLFVCRSEANGTNCGSVFSALGLDLASGKPRGSQLLFRSR